MRPSPHVVTLLILLLIGVIGGAVIAFKSVRGDPADFSVATTDNETFVLSAHRGEVVVVEFFATSCAPCRLVERDLKAATNAWNGSQVTVISIAIWGEGIDELRRYKQEHNLTWHIAPDSDQLTAKYGVYAIPHMVILDQGGQVVYEERGYGITQEKIEAKVAAALRGDLQPFGLLQYGLIGLASVAGAAAFFSPCAIGMLPAYVAHTVRSRAHAEGASSLKVGLVAALGVLLVFFGVGGLALLAGPSLVRYVPFLQPLIGFLLLVFGVLLLARPYSVAVMRLTAPITKWAMDVDEGHRGSRSFFAYGIAYGAAAAGCTIPVLLSVFVTAAASGPLVGSGIVLVYAFTGAFFMVLLTVLSGAFGGALGPRLARSSRIIEAVAACLFILGGAFLIWFSLRAGTFQA